MRRPVASVLLALTLAVQANVVPCPMTGGHPGHEAMDGAAHAGHEATEGATHAGHEAMDGAAHATSSEARSHRPGRTSEEASSRAEPGGSSMPDTAASELPSPVSPHTGGCGAMMGCGLAAVAPSARTVRGVASLTPLRARAPQALASSSPLSAEPPPPRA